jgi:hypothetical protein
LLLVGILVLVYIEKYVIENNESIDQWGQFVTTPYSEEVAKVNIKTKLLRK